MRLIGSCTLAAVLTLGACSSSTEPAHTDTDPAPATIVLDSGTVRVGALRQEVMSLGLRNTGGAGSFKVQAWGLPTSPNGPSTLYGESESTNVAAGWKQAVSFEVTTGSTGPAPRIRWALVFSRDDQDVVWRQTARKDF